MKTRYKFSDFCQVSSSKRILKSEYVEMGIPFYRSKEVIEIASGKSITEPLYISHDRYEFLKEKFGSPKNGDILITSVGTLGITLLIDLDYEFYFKDGNLTWLKNIDSSIIDKNYLIHWLKSSFFFKQIDNNNIGAVQKALTISFLNTLEIELPKLPIQECIAKVLSDLDTKIELNNKVNTELEAMAKLIYDYWFVQFDFPDENGKPYKSSGGKMVYNEELKREIPAGWEVDSFSNWIANDKSGDWGKESEQGNYVNKVSCIRGADLNGLNGKGKVKSPTRYVLEKNSHKLLEIGDFIIEISGGSPVQSTGRMAFITEETLERFDNPLICSNFCKAVTLKDEKSIYNFAYEWNRLYDAGVLFGWEGKTSGIKNLLFDSFVTNHKVVLPSKESMELFYNKVKPIHAKIQKNLQQNQKLAELRDWLLPMLMNGQVRVN